MGVVDGLDVPGEPGLDHRAQDQQSAQCGRGDQPLGVDFHVPPIATRHARGSNRSANLQTPTSSWWAGLWGRNGLSRGPTICLLHPTTVLADDAAMDPSSRQLVHQVNNLLAVIETQAAVAEAVGTEEALRQALALIRKRADELAHRGARLALIRRAQRVRRARAVGAGPSAPSVEAPARPRAFRQRRRDADSLTDAEVRRSRGRPRTSR